jgi:poly(A) polymerase
MPRPTNEREFAVEVVRRLRDAGHEALFAGGCVRDELLGLPPKDYDVATDARPERVRALFNRTVAVGASFGVVEVIGPRLDGVHLKTQVATFRVDLYEDGEGDEGPDGRHPTSVVFCTAEEDARRRDFTINGMFLDPLTGDVRDYVGGRADLAARALRAIGDPHERFHEDRLRMLRAVRMAARFELAVDHATEAAVKEMAGQIHAVSPERIADELRKMLTDRHRARGMRLFVEMGLAASVLPELLPMVGLPQGPPRAEAALPTPGRPGGPLDRDLWEHVLAVLDRLGPSATFPLAFAALLHDVGKPRTVGRTPDRYTFHGHEHVGARLADDISRRLRLSNDERERTVWLVEKHQALCEARQMRTSKLKALLAHPGIRELLALHRADSEASGRDADHVEYCERLLEEWTAEDLDPPPLLTGHDLQRDGLKPGPLFKKLLAAVREAQLDGEIRTPPEARRLVARLLAEEGGGATQGPSGPGSTPGLDREEAP